MDCVTNYHINLGNLEYMATSVGARLRQHIMRVWGTFPLFTYMYSNCWPRPTHTAC